MLSFPQVPQDAACVSPVQHSASRDATIPNVAGLHMDEHGWAGKGVGEGVEVGEGVGEERKLEIFWKPFSLISA